jgi:FkbM family methyltransferase
MGDKLKPENIKIVEKIRKFESELFKTQDFKMYRNYCVPEYHVANSKNVLSFGIGGDANFEKLICVDNKKLDVRMFDPTPATVLYIKSILNRGGGHYFDSIIKGNKVSQKIVRNCLKFYPVAYGPKNGTFTFYPPKNYKDMWNRLPTPASFSLINLGNNIKPVEVECKNITTIMQEFEWDTIDILKTDVEGLWYEVGKEIANLDVKYWVSEIELGIGMTINESFAKVRELYNLHRTQYNIYINRKRDKKMMELIFCRKDIDES